MVNHLLRTYTTDAIVAETDNKIHCYVKRLITSPLRYPHEQWLRTLRCPHIYIEFVLRRTLVYELPQFNWYSMRAPWSSHKNAPLQNLAYHAPSLTKLRAAPCPKGQPALNSNNWHKLRNCQSNLRREKTNSIISSSRRSTRRRYSDKGAAIAAVNDSVITSLTSTPQKRPISVNTCN